MISRSGSIEALTIRLAQPEDILPIVESHLQSFPGFFLTLLGRDFLTLLYAQLLTDAGGVVLLADTSSTVVGFVAGVLHQRGFYARLVEQHKWAFARAASGAILRQPSVAPRLFRALRRPVDAQQSTAEACLMSIAVRPDAAGGGIGRQLVKAFCTELSRRGAPAVCLTTDRDNNERANRFYRQLGFELSRTYITPEGRAMNEYFTSLPLDA